MVTLPLQSERIRLRDAAEEVQAYFYDNGLTDGLPIIPPTPDAVQNMLAYTDLPPHEVLAALPPRKGQATVEKIAVNAVMAGCLPRYLPVVIAAVQALADDAFNLYGVLATTHPCTPMIFVNGPIARELDINAGYNAMGQGWRSNATIGRAVRLVMTNVAGAVPGDLDRATLGTPAKYSYCFAENEADSPWEPWHVECGYPAEVSTVTVVGAEAPHNVNDHGSIRAESILTTVAETMAVVGCNNATGGGQPVVVFGPEHAATVAAEGLTKKDVKNWLYERARIDIGRFSPENAAHFLGEGPGSASSNTRVAVASSKDDLIVLVAGGAGKHSCFIPTFGQTRAVTRPLALRNGTPAASIDTFRQI